MYPAEWMDQLVYDLIEHYAAEVRPSGLIYLELRMRGHGVLIIEEQVKQTQMRVCYLLFDADGRPVFEPELLFYIDLSGAWIPYAIQRHTAGQYTYADLDIARSEFTITDAKHQAALAIFADGWAETLRAQGWIGGAGKCITQSQQSHHLMPKRCGSGSMNMGFALPPTAAGLARIASVNMATSHGCWSYI